MEKDDDAIVKATVANIKNGEPYDVYIGRSGVGKKRNPLGNPYQIGPDGDREEVIRKCAYDFPLRWRTEPDFREAVLSCRGMRLGCYCFPQPCHGNIYCTFVNNLHKGEDYALKAVHDKFLGQTTSCSLSQTYYDLPGV